uniref:Uncharacterized protein n=1 Tax=Romanomermis culicivorax TaxID=13658 RepID=A0A915IQK1_ROMCU
MKKGYKIGQSQIQSDDLIRMGKKIEDFTAASRRAARAKNASAIGHAIFTECDTLYCSKTTIITLGELRITKFNPQPAMCSGIFRILLFLSVLKAANCIRVLKFPVSNMAKTRLQEPCNSQRVHMRCIFTKADHGIPRRSIRAPLQVVI